MSIEILREELDLLLDEINQKIKVDSPLFLQKSHDYSEVISRAGKLWAKCVALYEGTKLDFEIWEASTEISVREYLENVNNARASMKEKPERVTEARVASGVKTDSLYRSKKKEIIEAQELLNLAEKAAFEASKVRGFISQAIIRKRDDVK
jgi:hypothetical protein